MDHRPPLLALLSLALFTSPAAADERRFTYIYESTTVPKGDIELEQWITWKTHTREDHDFDRFDFRHEIELGVTDHFQLAFYVADWHYEDGESVENDGVDYDDSALEFKYSFTDPVKDPLGLAAYAEVKLGDELFELEGKFIAQKNLGPWVLAYNATLEAAWEGDDYEEREGEIINSLGASYEITPSLLVGGEALWEIPLPDWHSGAHQNLFAGPNLSYRAEKWWVTTTALAQLADTADEPDFQLRMIFGIGF